LGVLLVLTEHAVIAPTGGGAHTVAGDRNRRLQRHPFVQLAVDQPFLSTVQALQVFANALLADVDSVAAELDRPVIDKQIGRLAPKPAIDVESERALELRSEEHTSELQSRENLVCRLLLEKKKRQDVLP